MENYGIPSIPAQMDALGGYLALEVAREGPLTHPGAHAFQSGRGAFLALLEVVKPAKVWLPWYLCDSMSEPLEQAGVKSQRYRLAPDFSIGAQIDLGPRDLLLSVNYFGLMDRGQQKVLTQYPVSQVVIDNSQALYSPALRGLASIYSPRKFLGVPDGGYLVAAGVNIPGYREDSGSLARSRHLLERIGCGAEAGYAAFTKAEASLSGLPPQRMSTLTQRLLASADHPAVQRKRRRNFAFLQERLGHHNLLQWTLEAKAVPLCYPFLPRRTGVRAALLQARIYTAAYWPELLDPAREMPQTERGWSSELLALPLDQRYEPDYLERWMVLPLLSLLKS